VNKGGDKLKTNAIIIIIIRVRGLNKSCWNSNLVVQQPLGTPRFQAQKHQLKIIKNSKRFDPPRKKLRTPRED